MGSKLVYNIERKEKPITLDELAKLGEEGWEMCGTFFSRPMGTPGYYTQDHIYYFKRQIEEDTVTQN